MIKRYFEILDTLSSRNLTVDELSTVLQLNTETTTNYVQFLVSKKFLIGFRQKRKESYKITSSGITFAENLKLVLV